MRFYLGTHRPHWLGLLDVPLFVSHRQLAKLKKLPRARTGWALDSGGFTEIDKFGRWVTGVEEYVAAVQRYEREIGNLLWASPMDWMCEEKQLEKTGMTVEDHQRLTVANYLELRGRGPFIPVLQGWSVDDYLRCVAMYADAGVDLQQEPLVGLGSVCKRQDEAEIGRIVMALRGLRIHGFGVKKQGLERYGHLLCSSDSMSWSLGGRFSRRTPGCTHTRRDGSPSSCGNCIRFALLWRDEVCRLVDQPNLFATWQTSAPGTSPLEEVA